MRHLLGISDLSSSDITSVLDDATEFADVLRRPVPKVPALRGKTVSTLFFEPSTRTRLSFERAAKALSADTVSFSVSTSSLSKGESLKDTALTIEAMGADLLVVRHHSVGAPHRIASWVSVPVVNGGDGSHEHPTQALLDVFTLRQRWGSLSGRRIAIVGDVRHSRVARSNVLAMTALGAEVTLVAPATLLPTHLEEWPVAVDDDLDALLPGVDCVYLLRVQRERGGASLFPSSSEYVARYGLDVARFQRMKPEAVVMHPGPMNRGVEIAPAVADDSRTLVLAQVSAGVAVRMAVLFRLLEGDRA